MNSSELENKTSDYLDGILLPVKRKEADTLLESDSELSKRFQNYTKMIHFLKNEERIKLPVALQKTNISWFSLKRISLQTRPWYFKSAIEAVSVVLLITLPVAIVPRLKKIYETNLQNRLDSIQLLQFESTLNEQSSSVSKVEKTSPAEVSAKTEVAATQEVTPPDSGIQPNTASPKKVGDSEVWRMNLKTETPLELEKQIKQTLEKMGVNLAHAITAAPGGIQFDFMVKKDRTLQIFDEVKKVNRVVLKEAAERESQLTWYKNKSKKPLPAGMTRIAIWISQM